MEEMEKTYSFLEDGGRFKPNQCIARHRVAIIVPFRDREEHLRTFFFHIRISISLPGKNRILSLFKVDVQQSECRTEISGAGRVITDADRAAHSVKSPKCPRGKIKIQRCSRSAKMRRKTTYKLRSSQYFLLSKTGKTSSEGKICSSACQTSL